MKEVLLGERIKLAAQSVILKQQKLFILLLTSAKRLSFLGLAGVQITERKMLSAF